MKKVSVIIPVYGVEKYIASTVQSVLEQTYKNFELLIIDDGSPDKSIEICQQFTDSRIKIISQENRGVAAARNTGIHYAEGEYIALLDGDDIWLPQKLEKHVKHLENSPDIGVSFSRSAFINEAGEPLGIYQMSKLEEITPLDLLCRTPVGNGSVAVIRREVFEAIKFQNKFYFDEDRQLHPSEDVECWLRIAIQTDWRIKGIPEALTLYRVNSGGFSAQIFKKLSSWEKMLEKLSFYTEKELMLQWRNPAMAYQLRHLSRRAVTLKAGSTAVELSNRALFTYWRILVEEPRRTLMTLSASYLLWLLPKSLYHSIENRAIQVTSLNQRRRIVQDQSSQ